MMDTHELIGDSRLVHCSGIIEVVQLQHMMTCLILFLLHPLFQIFESFHHLGFDLGLGLVEFVLKIPEYGIMSMSNGLL